MANANANANANATQRAGAHCPMDQRQETGGCVMGRWACMSGPCPAGARAISSPPFTCLCLGAVVAAAYTVRSRRNSAFLPSTCTMAQKNGDQGASNEEADFAKAFQELARGEQTATALENHLSALEAKIEELLAQADRDQRATSSTSSTSSTQQKVNGSTSATTKPAEDTKP